MSSSRFHAALAALVALAIAPSSATAADFVLGFEDLDGGVAAAGPLPTGYAGFTWENATYLANMAGTQYGTRWGINGAVCLKTMPSWNGIPPLKMRRAGTFTLRGAVMAFASAWTPQQVAVEGWRAGAMVFQSLVGVSMDPVAFAFPSGDVDEVRFVSDADLLIDDLEYTAPDTIAPYIELLNEVAFTGMSAVPVTGRAFDAGGAGIAEGYSGVARNAEFEVPVWIDASGRFDATIPLKEGPNAVLVQVTDREGNVGSRVMNVFRYDATGPAVVFLSPTDGAAVRGAVEVAIAASDASGVGAVSFSIDGGAAVPASGSGPWAAILDFSGLADGPHVVAVQAVDGLGNVATSQIGVVVDQTPPLLSMDAPGDGTLVRGVVTVTVSATDARSGVASIELRANGAVVASCAADRCSGSIDTSGASGPVALSAVAVDRIGNASAPLLRTVLADNDPPAVVIRSPATGTPVNGGGDVHVVVTDPAFASVECRVGDALLPRSTEPVSYLAFDAPRSLDGPLPITCTATDLVGNTSSDTVVVRVLNWSLTLTPDAFHLRSSPSSTVTLKIAGRNSDLLASEVLGGLGVSLAVAGGFPVPLGSGSDDVAVGVDDGVPYVSFKLNRATLVASLQGALSSGLYEGPDPVVVPATLVTAEGREMGNVWPSVR